MMFILYWCPIPTIVTPTCTLPKGDANGVKALQHVDTCNFRLERTCSVFGQGPLP